jgi:hypothetical protein
VWVETDSPCGVEILGCRARSLAVGGRHYALVIVEGLTPGAATPYQVRLDGEVRWPQPSSPFPPSVLRTPGPEGVRLMVGSCRVGHPHHPPYTLMPRDHPDGHGPDALEALALRMVGETHERWPHLLLHIGDQVYADELPPVTAALVRRRSRPGLPRDQAVDLEEYRSLYVESWSHPTVRWLLSTVGNLMVFDDHEVHDDWNTSLAWVEEMRARPWWRQRVVSAFASYWLYQHLGNLSAAEARDDPGLAAALDAGDDATAAVLDLAAEAADHPHRWRWSHAHELPHCRVVVVDSRAARVLEPERRAMIDGPTEAWMRDRVRGDVDHLLVVSSLPVLLPPALHHVERWNERVCAGAWGRAAARGGERLRQALDLEHWAAFGRSLHGLVDGISEVAAGRRGAAPSSLLLLGGDVHFGYVSRARWPGSEAATPVHQVVSSPLRNPLLPRLRRELRPALLPGAAAPARLLARAAGVAPLGVRWRLDCGPWFDNQLATLEVEGERLTLRVERAVLTAGGTPALEPLAERRLDAGRPAVGLRYAAPPDAESTADP